MLPPIVKLVDDDAPSKGLDSLDPRHVLRNKALKEGDYEMYNHIDKIKSDQAQMQV